MTNPLFPTGFKPRKRIRCLRKMVARVRRLQLEKAQIEGVEPIVLQTLLAEEKALEFALLVLEEIYPSQPESP